MRFLLWLWIDESFANSCGPHSAKFTKRKKYVFHSCENRCSTNEIWCYKCNWSYWYGDPICRRASALQWEHFVFPAPPAKPWGMGSALWTPGWSKCCFQQICVSLLIEAFPKMWLLILLLYIVWCLIRWELSLCCSLSWRTEDISVSNSIADVHWM